MAGNSIVRYKSAHPPSLLRSIPFGQYLRLRTICSDEADYKIQSGALQERLLQRGYSHSLSKEPYKQASSLQRDDLLLLFQGQPKPTNGTFPCGACAYCVNLDTRSSVPLPDGTTWTSQHYVDCTTRGIVYLLSCPCGAFYVGITTCEFHRRIYDVCAASIVYYKSPIRKHIALVHGYAKVHLTFVPLSHIPPNL